MQREGAGPWAKDADWTFRCHVPAAWSGEGDPTTPLPAFLLGAWGRLSLPGLSSEHGRELGPASQCSLQAPHSLL